MRNITRRSVLAAVGIAAALPAPALLAAAAGPQPVFRHPSVPTYRFFDAAEARFIEAACERLIPAEASVPGALAAGVPRYLDHHLAGAWGAGERLYRHGPWQSGTPANGQPSRFAPAVLFRTALSAVRRELQKRGAPGTPDGAPFDEWPAVRQPPRQSRVVDARLPRRTCLRIMTAGGQRAAAPGSRWRYSIASVGWLEPPPPWAGAAATCHPGRPVGSRARLSLSGRNPWHPHA